MLTPRGMRRIATVLGACLAAAVTSGVTASAAPADFYEVPASALGGAPGTVVDTQPYRRCCRSRTSRGRGRRVHSESCTAPRMLTAPRPRRPALLRREPAVDRCGPPPTGRSGARHAGAGDQCAPSRLFQDGVHYNAPLDFAVEYEVLQVHALLSRGIDVVVTDYQGLGPQGCTATSTAVRRGTRCSTPLGL